MKNTSLTIMAIGLISLLPQCADAAWMSSSWGYRVQITVDNTKVDADLTDFPVYVDLSDMPAGFWTNAQADCDDIRVTTSDETTEVPVEIVACANPNGEIHFKAPSLANSSDTIFYLYYGNVSATRPAASDTYGSQNVWNSSYEAVHHLEFGFTDSTSNAYNGTNNWATSTSAGKMSGAATFGGGAYVQTSDIPFGGTSPISVQAWGNPSTLASGNMNLVNQGTEIVLRKNGSNMEWILNSFSAGDRITGAHGMSTGSWYSFTGTYSSATGMKVFAAGTEVASGSPTGTYANVSNAFRFGRLSTLTEYWEGDIDEVRILSSALTPEWIATEYDNQNDPGTFYTVGAQASQPSGDPPARKIRLQGPLRITGGFRLSLGSSPRGQFLQWLPMHA